MNWYAINLIKLDFGELYLGRLACSCWPCGGSSVDLGNHGYEPPEGQGEQTGGS